MTKEFISKLEEVMPAEELLFNPTPAFGKYRAIMPEEAAQHPAKFNTNLVEFLIKTYTKLGDIILDPMAGSGVLGVIAALHGRNAIQVEIEEKFFGWMEKARENVEKRRTFTPKGKIVNIHGDARRLSELLSQVDVILTSPPYAIDPKNVCHTREGKTLEDYDIKRGFKPTSHPRTGYSSNPDNIGNLPLGNIDAIITSPPYEGSLEGTSRHTRGGIVSRDPALAQTGTYAVLSEAAINPENIGNLKSSDEEYENLAKGLMTKSGKPTYLSEMLKVYRECYKVLKPNGLAVIVVKPFIRNKKPVDLPYHTYVLLSLCGFTLEKLYKLRLKQQSFWRRLLYRKYPDVERINHEYVLVMRKPHDEKTPTITLFPYF